MQPQAASLRQRWGAVCRGPVILSKSYLISFIQSNLTASHNFFSSNLISLQSNAHGHLHGRSKDFCCIPKLSGQHVTTSKTWLHTKEHWRSQRSSFMRQHHIEELREMQAYPNKKRQKENVSSHKYNNRGLSSCFVSWDSIMNWTVVINS